MGGRVTGNRKQEMGDERARELSKFVTLNLVVSYSPFGFGVSVRLGVKIPFPV